MSIRLAFYNGHSRGKTELLVFYQWCHQAKIFITGPEKRLTQLIMRFSGWDLCISGWQFYLVF